MKFDPLRLLITILFGVEIIVRSWRTKLANYRGRRAIRRLNAAGRRVEVAFGRANAAAVLFRVDLRRFGDNVKASGPLLTDEGRLSSFRAANPHYTKR